MLESFKNLEFIFYLKKHMYEMTNEKGLLGGVCPSKGFVVPIVRSICHFMTKLSLITIPFQL